jgi:hypothetical protein
MRSSAFPLPYTPESCRSYEVDDALRGDTSVQRDFKQDIFAVLSRAPEDVPAVLTALRAGTIDGTCYFDIASGCGCLAGTLLVSRVRRLRDSIAALCPGAPISLYARQAGLRLFSVSYAETWFDRIRPGMTPQNNKLVAMTEAWVLEFMITYGIGK